jgi:hypothetical protein
MTHEINISQGMRINKYLPIVTLYFFLNSILLPLGLLYTSILTPFFLFWLYRQNQLKNLWYFFLFSIPFACIHYFLGVDTSYYLKSYLLLFSTYVFLLSTVEFLRIAYSLRTIFRKILIFNFFLVIIACIALFIPRTRDLFWYVSNVSEGILKFPRLRMFTYEPSYYSTLLVPLAFYYYLKILLFKFPNAILVFVMVTLPLFLSFSLGVILGILISFFILFFSNIKSFLLKKNIAPYFFLALIFIAILLFIQYYFFPDNPFLLRIKNIYEGRDTSFNGRTFDSFYLAFKVAEMKSLLFGVGLGQVKLLGVELWNTFYQSTFSINDVSIPNAVAETFAIYGMLGLVFRFGLEIYFFFRTKVYNNYYRLGLFIFIFIYQFTGSYLFNIAEYVIWALAFSNVFEEFNKTNSPKKNLP